MSFVKFISVALLPRFPDDNKRSHDLPAAQIKGNFNPVYGYFKLNRTKSYNPRHLSSTN